MTERALVLGSGFIGSHIARSFVSRGVETVILTRSQPTNDAEVVSHAHLILGDASHAPTVTQALREASHVVYCAGGLFPSQSNQEPLRDIQLTLNPLLTVLELLRHRPETGLTFISSGGTVYGRTNQASVDEAHPTDPVTSYGILKLASEKYISMYCDLYGLHSNVLRCSNVYGQGQPSNRGQGVIAAFLHRLASGLPLAIYGDGSVIRDFLHVSDLTAVVNRLTVIPRGCRVVNVGSGHGTTISELLEVIATVTGLTPTVQMQPGRPFDVPGIVLDVRRLKGLMDFEPLPLAQGVRATWDHVRF